MEIREISRSLFAKCSETLSRWSGHCRSDSSQRCWILTRTLTSVHVVKAIPESCSNFTVKKFIVLGPSGNGPFTTDSLVKFPSLQRLLTRGRSRIVSSARILSKYRTPRFAFVVSTSGRPRPNVTRRTSGKVFSFSSRKSF